ncbi:MAG: hypothetical protein HYY16_04175 [Planctomycetes bacterium]|nr:hypothetical protein [Planctomycetota bacterium]
MKGSGAVGVPRYEPPPPGSPFDAADAVRFPAVCLMVVAALGAAFVLLLLLSHVVGMTWPNELGDPREQFMEGAAGVLFQVLSLIIDVLVFLGGLQMMRLRSYGLAMTACILTLIPCSWSCCILGLPFGLWGLIVLSKEEVRRAFGP